MSNKGDKKQKDPIEASNLYQYEVERSKKIAQLALDRGCTVREAEGLLNLSSLKYLPCQ